ncbi:MAG: 4-hydroxy-tetrahydrodipicolinate reductase [Bacteroidales bacterium]|nr:4-hydroxy-tetrahydrodipicolinate reductase [Bacteroidales bacterium]
MKIVISGYGRMGHEIEKTAVSRGHQIVGFPDNSEAWESISLNRQDCDVVIDFSTPQSAEGVVNRCLEAGVPVVSGTTGWPDGLEKAVAFCRSVNGAFFYSPNFSIGVNIFFEISKTLASLLSGKEYQPRLNEIHHIHKLDAPSGTAIALANDIVQSNPGFTGWTAGPTSDNRLVPVLSERIGEIPGTHIVEWRSMADTITLRHEAHNRQGLALGAVLAAEWIQGKTGFYTMADLLRNGN